MGPAAIALISGGLNLAGSAMQQGSSVKMAREQMRFQERMSSTAHQREVEDLRKAGLNPLLSVNAGADAPGGAMGEARNVAGEAVSSAQQGGMLARQMALIKAQVEKVKTEKESVDLDNFRKEVWMGVGRSKMFQGAGIDGVPISSPFYAEMSSAKAMAQSNVAALSERQATSEMWKKVGSTGKGIQFLLPLLQMLMMRR